MTILSLSLNRCCRYHVSPISLISAVYVYCDCWGSMAEARDGESIKLWNATLDLLLPLRSKALPLLKTNINAQALAFIAFDVVSASSRVIFFHHSCRQDTRVRHFQAERVFRIQHSKRFSLLPLEDVSTQETVTSKRADNCEHGAKYLSARVNRDSALGSSVP